MKFILFVTIILLVFSLLILYIIKRFVNKLHIKDKYKKLFKLFLYINFVGVIGYIYARYNPNLANEIFFLLSLPIGILFLIFCVAIFYDITHTILNKSTINKERREFLKKSLDIGSFVMGSTLIAKSIHQATFIEIEELNIQIKNLNNKYNIVQISDIHIGGLIDAKLIKTIVQKVNNLNPDVVVITGDLVDISLKYATKSLDELSSISSKYGTYFIVGNHEYIHGVDDIINEVDLRGIKVLQNESIFIGEKDTGFNLIGVYDVMGYRVKHHEPDLKKSLENINPTRPNILLAHQPRFIYEIDELKTNNIDLVLSGHTHGGQIYPFKFLVSLVQPYIAGLYKHNSKTQIYVNKGTGYWGPPMRLGTSCEITKINLTS